MRSTASWSSPPAALKLFAGAGVLFVVVWVSVLIAGPVTAPGRFSFEGTLTQ